MCYKLEAGGATVTIMAWKAAKKISEDKRVDVREIEEVSGEGIPARELINVQKAIAALADLDNPKIVNCTGGVHRSVVIAILYLNSLENSLSVQDLYKQWKGVKGNVSALVSKSLKTLGYRVFD